MKGNMEATTSAISRLGHRSAERDELQLGPSVVVLRFAFSFWRLMDFAKNEKLMTC